MPRFVDLSGTRFGRLTVVVRAENIQGNPNARWMCRCDCGGETVALGHNLKQGQVTSCGCVRRAVTAKIGRATKTHGHSYPNESPTYISWECMLSRCTNPHDKSFKHYGARGINVCEQWRTFGNFLADMGERPPGTTIDRINVDGDYEPANCRWATAKEQRANQRTKGSA
ncbi:MAG: hypothetical protein KGP14_15280 [Betaproteobacteria bacterium]|nr:hypothetical protein [Betaproteobacteria bacterium]